jgi:hypothetical protein
MIHETVVRSACTGNSLPYEVTLSLFTRVNDIHSSPKRCYLVSSLLVLATEPQRIIGQHSYKTCRPATAKR